MRSKIAAFTILEVLAVSALLLPPPWIYVLVAAGFLAEHIASWNAKHPDRGLFELDGAPLAKIAVVALFESATWIVWIRLTVDRPLLAGAVLIVGLLVGHVLERNTVAGLPLLRDPGRRVRESWDFTIIEAAAGIGWLMIIEAGGGILAALALFVLLFIEHEVSFKRPVRN